MSELVFNQNFVWVFKIYEQNSTRQIRGSAAVIVKINISMENYNTYCSGSRAAVALSVRVYRLAGAV
jgi:hypothetical protein